MDHGGMDHNAMDHDGMGMPEPGGIPLAGGGTDRDGLEMDVLNIPLGPLLPRWPGGLVVWCVLQGDVIVSATARVLPAAVGARPPLLPTPGARVLDDAATVLTLAGWGSAAATSLLLRDRIADGDTTTDGAVAALRRRVERSRSLRWSLSGLEVRGQDLRDTVLGWLATDEIPSDSTAPGERAKLDLIPDLIVGTELSTARLLIAGLALDTAALSSADSDPADPVPTDAASAPHQAQHDHGGHHG